MNNHWNYIGKTFLILPMICCIGIGNATSQPQEENRTLTFRISGFENNQGQTLLFIYRKNDKIPSEPFLQLEENISNNSAVIEIKDIPYGTYAAILAHDENANGEIDHRLGFPAEPLGYSNNWKLTLFSGMPTFEKLKFEFTRSSNECRIDLKE